MPHILYAAPLSLYSGKARAYLDWKGVDYEEVLSTPDVYRDVILPNVGRPVIPVVQTQDGAILQDTTRIIDHFEAAAPEPSVYPATPRQRLAALLLECFGDEWLVIPAMHYRWNYNEEWVYGEFGKTALPDGTPEEQYAIGKERGAAFKGFCQPLGITDATIPAIEASYEHFLRDFDAHLAKHPFLFGTRPSIGDYGLIGPLYAHLYRDPASGEIMARTAPRVAEWVRRMVEVETPRSGEFLPDDSIPSTLEPILQRMMAEQVPYLVRVAEMLGQWADANDAAEPPRAVGMADFTMEGVTGQRIATPFSLWMLQRGLDYLASLSGEERQACAAMLRSVGGEALLDFSMPVRLAFEDHKLTIEGRTD
ncbi:glutathione S-transferase [Erythrobacter litoralis]|uniref:Glutathione S-transferase n=1 Tax=Erythrobacter litoralis (strain HTCC2594) TaxID=314225 RepID=Q2N763_ERYLH|nr:glutathione S-transferase [Erythrobacter litoralis]ABC64478.1 glutathione S-transferase [Erythrobacter litoralis HTCC2594]